MSRLVFTFLFDVPCFVCEVVFDFVYSSIHYLFFGLFIYLIICLFIFLFIYLFIYSKILFLGWCVSLVFLRNIFLVDREEEWIHFLL